MQFTLEPGLTKEITEIVKPKHTASSLGSGGVEVLATPMLIALLEGAAMEAVQPHLPAQWTTVGTRVNIGHLAATPVGMQVTARAVLTKIDGRRLVFSVEAHDQQEKVAQGEHERFIVHLERFIQQAQAKAEGM
ncbi:MAG: thioesterase family protein [Firmicutes bacterium]|nr:thioesterase family protein [Bacillota bacterium]